MYFHFSTGIFEILYCKNYLRYRSKIHSFFSYNNALEFWK